MIQRIVLKMRKKMSRLNFINRTPMDYRLLMVIMLLNLFGLIMIYSASYYYCSRSSALGYNPSYFLFNQGKYVFLGIILMIGISFIDYHQWRKFAWPAYIGGVILIFLLKVPALAVEVNGAVRWLKFGPIQFQAAEPVKLAMILFFAHYIAKNKVVHPRNLWSAFALAGLVSALVFLISDNLSTAAIIFGMCCLLIFISHPKTAPFALVVAVGSVLAVAFIYFGVYLQPASSGTGGFRMERIRAWLFPDEYATTKAFQPLQAMYAIGAGGFFGKGLGQSLQKFKIPEPHNDFILAIIAEELGIFGVILLVFLFGYMLYRIYLIAQNAVDIFGKLIAAGVFSQIALQVILNIAVVSNSIPTTGVTLPFISAGGASVLFLLAELGIVFSVDKVSKEKVLVAQVQKEMEKQKKKRIHSDYI
ncbi:MAG: FtsW/RodA/SpoVE family cell cycle protein [Lachnospiraceae bacterium]